MISKTLFKQSGILKWLALLPVLFLTACVSNDMSDLERFVEDIKNQKNIAPPKLPEFPPEEIHLYPHSEGMARDPFASLEQEKTEEKSLSASAQKPERPECRPPNIHRNREPLEQFPLDALDMVGTLELGNDTWGLVEDPEGLIHQVQVNNYLGQNNGKIIHIGAQKIEMIELADDGTGCYLEREASLAMNVDDSN